MSSSRPPERPSSLKVLFRHLRQQTGLLYHAVPIYPKLAEENAGALSNVDLAGSYYNVHRLVQRAELFFCMCERSYRLPLRRPISLAKLNLI